MLNGNGGEIIVSAFDEAWRLLKNYYDSGQCSKCGMKISPAESEMFGGLCSHCAKNSDGGAAPLQNY